MPKIVSVFALLVLVMILTSCGSDSNDGYVHNLAKLFNERPDERCIESWFEHYEETPEVFLPPRRFETLDALLSFDNSLSEEAAADDESCDALLTCWPDLDDSSNNMFMQLCTRQRMRLRIEES